MLATTAPDGRPRQSVVYYARDGERLLISTRVARLKARDVRRTGLGLALRPRRRAALPIRGVLGPAEILTEDIGAATAAIMQRIAGNEEPPEAQSDKALAAVDRVILAITVERVSAINYM